MHAAEIFEHEAIYARGLIRAARELIPPERADEQRRKMRYIHHALRLKCLPDLLPFFRGAHDPVKELTESIGMFNAVRRHLGQDSPGWRDVLCIVPGDGAQPRTGALVSLCSRWTVVSIDPALKSPKWLPDRLSVYPGRAEEFLAAGGLDIYSSPALTVILAVHSHAPLEPLWQAIRGPKVCLAMPCCVPQTTGSVPAAEHSDPAVLSPHRRIVVWDECPN